MCQFLSVLWYALLISQFPLAYNLSPFSFSEFLHLRDKEILNNWICACTSLNHVTMKQHVVLANNIYWFQCEPLSCSHGIWQHSRVWMSSFEWWFTYMGTSQSRIWHQRRCQVDNGGLQRCNLLTLQLFFIADSILMKKPKIIDLQNFFTHWKHLHVDVNLEEENPVGHMREKNPGRQPLKTWDKGFFSH